MLYLVTHGMKRYLIPLILLFSCAGSYAQSISFGELLNLTNMTDLQAHNLLIVSKGFKSAGVQTYNGLSMEQFKMVKTMPETEEIVYLGILAKGQGGVLSRQVNYFTLQEADINAMLAQAKKSTLSLVFQGSDLSSNIYRFDNSLFRASISLGFDKKSGSVQVQEKE